MEAGQTWDDRYGLINKPNLHYGVVTTAVNFDAGVDNGATVILCNAAITVTLPPAASHPGKAFWIKQIANSASTVARSGADTIDGATSQVLAAQYDVICVVSDGVSAWSVLSA